MSVAIGIVGSGRLATALVPHLRAKGVTVSGIWGRNDETARRVAAENAICLVSGLHELVERSRIIILAVSDDALEEMATELAAYSMAGRVVIHASGCRGLDVLGPVTRAGGVAACVHPLMTMVWNEGQPNPLEKAPCGVACLDRRWNRLLTTRLVRAGNPCFPLRDGDRPLYHAAAVLACAGLSQLFTAASGLLAKDLGISVAAARSLLMPLARKTLSVCGAPGPVSCTGPWTRGDGQTVSMHVEALMQSDEKIAAVYEALMDLAKETT